MYPVAHSTFYKFYCTEITEEWRSCYLNVREGEVEIELPLHSTPEDWLRFLDKQAITVPMPQWNDVTTRLVDNDLVYESPGARVVISNVPLTIGTYEQRPEWGYISSLPPELSRLVFEPSIFYIPNTFEETQGTLVVATPSIRVEFDVEVDLDSQESLQYRWDSSDVIYKNGKVSIMDADAYSSTFELVISERLYRRIEEVMPKPRKV